MQRLVNVDSLRDRFSVAACCGDCVQDERCCGNILYGYEGYTARDICKILNDEPAVDAIPIEWLKQKYRENDPDGGNEDFDRYLWDSICYVLTAWKEDQGEEDPIAWKDELEEE